MVLIVVFIVIVATQMALSGFAQDYDHYPGTGEGGSQSRTESGKEDQRLG